MSSVNNEKLLMVLRMDIMVCFGKKKMQASEVGRAWAASSLCLTFVCCINVSSVIFVHVRRIS
jgi:hypothetical protein